MNKDIQKIVYLSFYFALTLLLTLSPNIGLIQIGPVSINLATLVVPIMVVHLGALGMLSGLFLGLGSFLAAQIYGKVLFIYPDVSILPRALLGIFIYLIYKTLGQIKYWKVLILGFSSAVLNTILVSFFLLLHNYIWPFDFFAGKDAIIYWFGLILINMIAEPIIITIIVTLMTPLFIYFEKKRKNQYLSY